MSAHGAPPAVDEGDPGGWLATLRREMLPTPGRFSTSLTALALVLAAVTIGEVFRLPSVALLGFFAFYLFGTDQGTTLTTAAAIGAVVFLASLTAIVVFMATLSQPALRIPVMAVLTFAAGFLRGASRAGTPCFFFGFWATYSLTQGDSLLQVALQPGAVSNTTDPGLPDLAYFPPEEALVHYMLWLMLVICLAVVLVLLANALTGRDPAAILRQDLADRLGAAAAFCEGAPEARERLAGLAKEGATNLTKLVGLSRKLHRHAPAPPAGERLVPELARLVLALLPWDRVGAGTPPDLLQSVGQDCRTAERAVRAGAPVPGGGASDGAAKPVHGGVPDAVLPLRAELSRTTQAIKRILSPRTGQEPDGTPGAGKEPGGFFTPDAFSNPEHIRFGLKLTLAVMTCYAVERLANWPGIQTCVVTCFLVSLDTVGQSVQQMLTRLTGAVIGAALGIGVILLLMPSMTDLGELLLVLTPVTLLAAWIKNGGARTFYVGVQIALAYFLVVLQGFGPTVDMETGRDRVVGILLGDFVMYLVFTTLWPVTVADKVRQAAADALGQLADLLALRRTDPSKAFDLQEKGLRQDFAQAIAKMRQVMVNDPYEAGRIRPDRGRRPIDPTVVTQVQALIIPVSVILGDQPDPAWRDQVPQASRDAAQAHQDAMAAWLRRFAAWMRTGEGAASLSASLPDPPALEASAGRDGDRKEEEAAAHHLAGLTAWHHVLRRDVRTILDEIGPGAQPAAGRPAQEPALASP